MKKRKYNKVDITKLSPQERKAHEKHLAEVRDYTRARREWENKIKSGELVKTVSLSEYRHGLVVGKKPKLVNKKITSTRQIIYSPSDLDEIHAQALNENARLSLAEELIKEIKGSKERQDEIIRKFKS